MKPAWIAVRRDDASVIVSLLKELYQLLWDGDAPKSDLKLVEKYKNILLRAEDS